MSNSTTNRNQPPLHFTPTSDLYDKYLDKARVPTVAWRSFGARRHFCGYAVTVQCWQDNSRVKEWVETPAPTATSVLVVMNGNDHETSMMCALLGDGLAASAIRNGWQGLVVYGCVRDVDALSHLNLGIFALGSTPRKSIRRGEGLSNVMVQLGDSRGTVHPGDLVFADSDGVIILSSDEAHTNNIPLEKIDDEKS